MATNIIFSKGSGLNESIYGNSYGPIKMLIEAKAEAFEKQSLLPVMFNMEKSNKSSETITGMTPMTTFKPVVEGGAFPKNSFIEGFSSTIKPKQFMSEFEITREMVEDSNTLNFKSKPTAFVNAYYRTREMFGAALLTKATGNSVKFEGESFSTLCNDGLSFFNKEHISKTQASLKQSNLFSNDFNDDTLGLVETAMQNFKDDEGNPLSVIPDTIIIPNNHALKKAVFAAIGSDKDPSTSNNGFNYQFGRWTVSINPYWIVTGSEKPFIISSSSYNKDNYGSVFFDRINLTIKADTDPNTWNMLWQGRARFGAGFNDWRSHAMGGVAGGTTLS